MRGDTQTVRCWRATLSFHGTPVLDRVLAADASLTAGEGGDIVMPGIGDRVPLLVDGSLRLPPGEELHHEAIEHGVLLRPEAHEAVELRLTSEMLERGAFRQGLLRMPTRELLYGFTAAMCLASLVAIDVAVSPARTAAKPQAVAVEERSPLVHAMFSVPPPAARAALPERGLELDTPEPDPDDETAAPEPEPLAQLEPDAVEPEPEPAPEVLRRAPKKKRNAPREPEPMDEVAILAHIGPSDAGVLSALIGPEDGSALVGGIGIVEGSSVADARSTPLHELPPEESVESGGEEHEEIADVLPAIEAEPAELTQPGRGTPDCEMEFRPRTRTQVVFVVDASPETFSTLDSVLRDLDALDRRIRRHDPNPGYGLVVFADEVTMPVGSRPVARGTLRSGLRRAREASPDRIDEETDEITTPPQALSALERAAKGFAWGDEQETLRLVIYVGHAPLVDAIDDAAAKRYRRTVAALEDRGVRVASITPRTDPNPELAGLGFWRPLRGQLPIPQATAGLAFSTNEVTSGGTPLDTGLADLLQNPVCKKSAISSLFE
jgi:hypothetical protein